MQVEGFDYHSFDATLVGQVLEMYVSGAGYQTISESGLPVSFASAQRIIDAALANGTLLPEQKHEPGLSQVAREKARRYIEKYPAATPPQLARLAGCSESTVYRAKRGE